MTHTRKSLERAVELAVKAGWNLGNDEWGKGISVEWLNREDGYANVTYEKTVCNHQGFLQSATNLIYQDPSFWQALGKSLGWKMMDLEPIDAHEDSYATWELVWHRFIDHLAQGGDPESFFESLLGNK